MLNLKLHSLIKFIFVLGYGGTLLGCANGSLLLAPTATAFPDRNHFTPDDDMTIKIEFDYPLSLKLFRESTSHVSLRALEDIKPTPTFNEDGAQLIGPLDLDTASIRIEARAGDNVNMLAEEEQFYVQITEDLPQASLLSNTDIAIAGYPGKWLIRRFGPRPSWGQPEVMINEIVLFIVDDYLHTIDN